MEVTEIDPEVNEENERQSKKQEAKYRLAKKIFSTVLFGSTLGLAYMARRKRQRDLALNLEGCVRLPIDIAFHGSHKEFYRVPNPATGKPTYVLPGSMVKDGTIRAIKSFDVRPDDVFVASFPKSGYHFTRIVNLEGQRAHGHTVNEHFMNSLSLSLL